MSSIHQLIGLYWSEFTYDSVLFSPASLSFRPDLPFKFIGGDPSLDLVNTVDWTQDGLENDRLTDYTRLTQWAEEAGVISKDTTNALQTEARDRAREAEAALEGARHTRWVLQRVFASLGSGQIDEQALADFNELLDDSLRRLVVKKGNKRNSSSRLDWSWRGLGKSLATPLWLVVWSAAQLLTSEEAHRVRACDGPDCGWLFVDRSRNGLRRWCDMATCGTQAKSRRRATRREAETPTAG